MEAPGKGVRRWEGRGGLGSGVKLSRGRLSRWKPQAPSQGAGVWKETAVFRSAKSERGPRKYLQSYLQCRVG